MVREIDPDAELVGVLTAPGPMRVFGKENIFDASEVLPGSIRAVAELFE